MKYNGIVYHQSFSLFKSSNIEIGIFLIKIPESNILNILICFNKPDVGFRIFKIRVCKYYQCFVQCCTFLVNLLKISWKCNGLLGNCGFTSRHWLHHHQRNRRHQIRRNRHRRKNHLQRSRHHRRIHQERIYLPGIYYALYGKE